MKNKFTDILTLQFINYLNTLGTIFYHNLILVQLKIAKIVNVMKTLLKIALKFKIIIK